MNLHAVQNANEKDCEKRHDIPRHDIKKVHTSSLGVISEFHEEVKYTSSVRCILITSRLIQAAIVQVICLLCDHEQDVKQVCENCGVCMGDYYCEKCKFFDDEVGTTISLFLFMPFDGV